MGGWTFGGRVGVLALAIGCGRADRGPSVAETGGSTAPDTAPGTGTTTGTEDTTGGSGLPPVPMLVSPEDGATEVAISTSLCWNPVAHPDGKTVRYRVFVDGGELSSGVLGEPGHAGPCLGPLVLAHERTYAWQVQAFEADDPERASEMSAAWSFTTATDGVTSQVFFDDFEEDLGWQIEGDATSGAWVRGKPQSVSHLDQRSQPGRCDGGDTCMFTGHNLAGIADDEDVAGGSTVLVSPPFDLSGAATATVQLRRFFYKSEPDAGPRLRIELLVPDAGEPSGVSAHTLELLEGATATDPQNLWTPREYAACGVEMAPGSRLRITATDEGTGILEAAIDTVSVHAHAVHTVCEAGEGSLCDPSGSACPDDLLCCARGPIHVGVYRCEVPVPGLDFDDPPANPDAPGTGPLGCDAPDLIIDPAWIEPVFTDIFVDANTCEVLEGCVTGLGWRTIMRFALAIPNVGSADLALGLAANNPDIFHYSPCHDHWHFDELARYELRDQEGVVRSGHKQGFCLLDTYSWAWRNALGTFDCANQGISRGFTDLYESDLPCQWVDVTDLAPGQYTLRATLNLPRPDSALPVLVERNHDNNTIEVPVTIE